MPKKRGIAKFGLKHDARWDVPPLTDEELRERMCGNKELRTEQDARTQAQMMRGKGEPMSAYQCPYCEYWHIGKRR